MWAEYMLTAEASVRASACALAMRARAWMFAYSGIAMAARIPMMATTIISFDEREAALVAQHLPLLVPETQHFSFPRVRLFFSS